MRKKLFSILALTAMLLVMSVSVQAATYVTRCMVSAGGFCRIGFEPDNVKQIVSKFVNATGLAAADQLWLWKSSAKLTVSTVATGAGDAGYAGQLGIDTNLTTNATVGDFVFVYLISGSSAGNYQIAKLAAVSAGTGLTLDANLTYTLPYGTPVYVMDASLGTILVGNATKEIESANGWLAAPAASPLIIDLWGPLGTALTTAINSCFCVYQ